MTSVLHVRTYLSRLAQSRSRPGPPEMTDRAEQSHVSGPPAARTVPSADESSLGRWEVDGGRVVADR